MAAAGVGGAGAGAAGGYAAGSAAGGSGAAIAAAAAVLGAARPAYFTRREVATHVAKHDAWVIAHGNVIDVSPLVPGAPVDLIEPILARAGEDISDWFNRGADGLPEVRARAARQRAAC